MANEDEMDYFQLGTGLPLDGAEVTVIKSVFEFNNEYKADACVAALTFRFDSAEGDDQTQLYSVGKGFEPIDRGEAVAHTSGRLVPFNTLSNYGKLITASMKLDGFMDEAKTRKLQPNSAGLWLGMKFKLGSITVPAFREGGKEGNLIIPVEYLGVDGGASETKAAPKLASKTPTKGAAKYEEDIPEDLLAQLREIATNADDFNSYAEAAMALDGTDEPKVSKHVLNSKPGGLWQDSRS